MSGQFARRTTHKACWGIKGRRRTECESPKAYPDGNTYASDDWDDVDCDDCLAVVRARRAKMTPPVEHEHFGRDE